MHIYIPICISAYLYIHVPLYPPDMHLEIISKVPYKIIELVHSTEYKLYNFYQLLRQRVDLFIQCFKMHIIITVKLKTE